MSNKFKIFISFLIVILLAIIFYVVFFSGFINLKFFNFLNSHLENKYQKELNKVSYDIENYLKNQESKTILPFIESFDLNKVVDKRRSKSIDLSNELSFAKNLIVSEKALEKIKFYDKNRKIIFSTDNKEISRKDNFMSFVSRDQIERRRDFYDKIPDKSSFIFTPDDRVVILKKNIEKNGEYIGLMLFYYKDIFLNDILRKNAYIEFKDPYYINNNIIILSKPKFVPEEYLFNFSLDEGRLREIVYRDKSGNEITKTYRLFSNNFKGFNISTVRFIDNEIFILDRKNAIILFYFFFFTFYLLLLAILFFRKTDFEKAKEKFSIFTAALLEEMIQANSREELERIHRHLNARKQIAFQNVLLDFKGLKSKDKDELESQIDSVFNKIEQSYQQRIGSNLGEASLERMEMLLEKFINTIAEKGIQINTPVKIGTANVEETVQEDTKSLQETKYVEVEELPDVQEIEEVENIDVVEELEEVQDDKIENLQEVEEIDRVEEEGEKEEVQKKLTEKEKLQKFPKVDISHQLGKGDNDLDNKDINTKSEKIKDEADDKMKQEKQKKDISLNNLFDFEEDFVDNSALEEIELLETVDEEGDHVSVPKIPDEFFKSEKNVKHDELSKEINELTTLKTPLQALLDGIFEKMDVEKLFLMINIEKEHSFIQIYQVGSNIDDVKKIVLDNNNVLVQHVYSTRRMIYVADVKKLKYFFNDEDFEKEYLKMKSLLIYPIEYFKKIRALIFFFFKKESKDRLEPLVEILDNNKKKIRKNILKII